MIRVTRISCVWGSEPARTLPPHQCGSLAHRVAAAGDILIQGSIAGGWGTATLIETDNAGGASRAEVVVDANDNALVVWMQSNGTRWDIRSSRFTVAGGWASAQKIEADDNGDAQNPQVGFDRGGNAIAVWKQSDGLRNNIHAARFE